MRDPAELTELSRTSPARQEPAPPERAEVGEKSEVREETVGTASRPRRSVKSDRTVRNRTGARSRRPNQPEEGHRMLRLAGLLALIAAAPAVAQSPAATPPACAGPERAEFDFWVGEWDVFPAKGGAQVARSTIERLYNGCAVRENWKPFSGASGGSLNAWQPESRTWKQAWIGSDGQWVEFTGRREGPAMVMQGRWPNVLGPGKDGDVRMSYTPVADGAVRQFGEVSVDGKTWKPLFDFVYRRSARPPSP